MTSLNSLYPELVAAEWQVKWNLPFKPNDLKPSSKVEVWWRCEKGHLYRSSVSNRVNAHKKGSKHRGCNICAGKDVIPETSLAEHHPKIAAEWHPTLNNLLPYQVASASNNRVWWQCPVHKEHVWESSVYDRTRLPIKKRAKCDYCQNRKLSTTNSLATLSPELAAEFDSVANAKTPDEVIATDQSQKYKWICSHNPNHQWPQKIYVRYKQKAGCPFCPSQKKWEADRTADIKELIGQFGQVVTQKKIDGFFYDVELLIAGEKILIELDGEQHYMDKPKWNSSFAQQNDRDRLKTKTAEHSNYRIARIPFWVRTKRRTKEEVCNILAAEPTYENVPRLADLNIKEQPCLTENGRHWWKKLAQSK